MELANSKFGGELSNNKYSNIIGVHTSVYNPSGGTKVATAPTPPPATPTKSHQQGHDNYPYPSDIIYPYPYPYPYLYPPLANQPLEVIQPVITQQPGVTEKVTEKSVTPTPTAVIVSSTSKSSPVKTVVLLGVAALLFGGYKLLKK